jgi:geranylgeranyl reductase family protein
VWDVLVVGGGPAGLSAARAAASGGARVAVLERSAHPRYKVCGGGLLGWSLAAAGIEVPARDVTRTVRFTRRGRLGFSRGARTPLVSMVLRTEFDAALRDSATAAGAVVLERRQVRSVRQDADAATAVLADGSTESARVIIGADGSAGVTARHVGVRYDQVDLGLEQEWAVPEHIQRRWRGRLLLDWGPVPGSYGWVFPKGDSLTVGVIAERGHADATRRYLADFVNGLDLPTRLTFRIRRDGGHLTRCRAADSPLRRGRVLVAGDAAGLLEPWTREGISFALRSGTAAGTAAATGDLGSYEPVELLAEMAAGRRLYRRFRDHPALFHALLATPVGWRAFQRFCRGEQGFAEALRRVGPGSPGRRGRR